jgi:hypothetical protein
MAAPHIFYTVGHQTYMFYQFFCYIDGFVRKNMPIFFRSKIKNVGGFGPEVAQAYSPQASPIGLSGKRGEGAAYSYLIS